MVVLETIVRLELLVISKGKKKKKFMWYLRFFFFLSIKGILDCWFGICLAYIYIYILSFELICNDPN